MNGFADALRALMAARDISGNSLGRQLPCNRALICRYRSGKQKPSAKMARRCDEVLGADGDLVALAEKPQPGRRVGLGAGLLAGALLTIGPEVDDRPVWAARNPLRIDTAVVASFAAVLASQRRAEDALGAPAILNPALVQLGLIEDLMRQARGPVRPALVNVAQQWAQFAAYLHRDIGDTTAEHARLAQALEWATEIDDRTM